jgi:hypothetical protein
MVRSTINALAVVVMLAGSLVLLSDDAFAKNKCCSTLGACCECDGKCTANITSCECTGD